MNVLIINAHSSKNKGDAGILLSMIDSIRKHATDCDIRIKSRFPMQDKTAYDVEVKEAICNVPVDPKIGKHKKLVSAFKLLVNLSRFSKLKDEDYEWADVVVSCGGGFLLSHGMSVALLQHLSQIKAAKDYNKPVIIYSQSIGPFYNSFMKRQTAKILNQVDRIFIRESISKKWLTQMNLRDGLLELVPDSAFCMQMEKSSVVDEILNKVRDKHQGPIIGVTARDWNFPEVADKKAARTRYMESLEQVARELHASINAKILFLPQVLGPNPFNDDRIISREIVKSINGDFAELVDYDFKPRELKYLYSKLDMFIGTRMHSNIFALSAGIPTVAINYEHKTKGIMELLGLSDYVLEINNITSESIIETSRKCWENHEKLSQFLSEKIPSVVRDAEIPALYLKTLK